MKEKVRLPSMTNTLVGHNITSKHRQGASNTKVWFVNRGCVAEGLAGNT
jgi:hypothetical protein